MLERLLARRPSDDGSAIVEFVFVAVVIMVPLVYLVAAVATVQRTNLAVTAAAREAGRAYATSDTTTEAAGRSRAAVRLALDDQGLDVDDRVDVRFVRGTDCTAEAITPSLRPGGEFTVCVTRRVELPGVPSILAGRGVRSVGMFRVHVDDFRSDDGG